MKTEVFEKDFFNQCAAKHKLSGTGMPDSQRNICSNCKTPLISMRLERTPQKGPGTKIHKEPFIFRGCPNCNTVSYDEDDFLVFAAKECTLKDYLLNLDF